MLFALNLCQLKGSSKNGLHMKSLQSVWWKLCR